MRNISSSSVTTSVHHAESAQSSETPVSVGTASHAPAQKASSSQFEGLPTTRRSAQSQHAHEAEGSPSHGHEWRAKAFDAQRREIQTHAGPSNNRHLNALEKLQQRGFKPAVGGLEIPSTPHGLLGGGGKRVYHGGEASRHVTVVPIANRDTLQDKITDKQLMIRTLTEDLARETDPGQIAISTQLLREARQELIELVARARVLGNEHRRVNANG